jgi:choline dehydrogenase-like flavoprotein
LRASDSCVCNECKRGGPPASGRNWCNRRRAPGAWRPNLQLVTNALVYRILFDGKRAIGVEFAHGGRIDRAYAAREVILAAGAIGSPHILQLSGVGDPEHLGRIGVPVVHDCAASAKTCRTTTWRSTTSWAFAIREFSP